jgi:hypothetical protein
MDPTEADLNPEAALPADEPRVLAPNCDGNQSGPNRFCFDRADLEVRGILKVAEDLDRDGHVDLAIIDEASGVLTVLFGRGDGTFEGAAQVVLPAPPFRDPYFDPTLVALDYNGDRAPDLALAFTTSSELWVVTNRGDRSFELATRDVINLGSSAPLAIDANQDGHDDLVFGAGIGTPESTLELLRSTNDDHVYTQTTAPCPWAAITSIVEFDNGHIGAAGSARRILAVGTWAGIRDETPVLAFTLENGSLQFDEHAFLAGADPFAILVGDIDANGKPDAIVGNRASGDFTVVRQDSTGELTPPFQVPVARHPLCESHGCKSMAGAAIGDFNGDGQANPLASMTRDRKSARLYIINGADLLWVADDAYYPVAADFNEDGIDDIVYSYSKGTHILLSAP